jgi:ribonucleoside-diphosphate reductase alpha chain
MHTRDVFQTSLAANVFRSRYSMNGQETWDQTCRRVVDAVTGQFLPESIKAEIYEAMCARKFIPGGRYLYSAGREFHQVNNCFLFRAEDSREGWADAMHKCTSALMTGGGIGFDYSLLRERGAQIRKTGGTSTGPIALMKMVNEAGRYVMQGGQRRSAIWAGLRWDHPDAREFIHMKDWPEHLRTLKRQDPDFPLPMEGTNISVIYDTAFFMAIENKHDPKHALAWEIWRDNCRQAFSTAEPGMSFNFCKDSESLRNACTEVTSSDDSDKCNLGTVWLNRCSSKSDFARICHIATAFLLCGGLYSHLPFAKIKEVGDKNNRIGLGLGGIHEWLMARGYGYEVTPELHKWLNLYERESNSAAYIWSRELGVAIPKGKRSIAPTGTIGIIAETTTGIEPLFCKAYKRSYLLNNEWRHEYVVDGAVKRLLDQGLTIEKIQDAYDIPFQQRVKFQADVQNYVDMAISSTCNLPAWGSENNNDATLETYSRTLLRYAKRLRGFTCYPDGARDGQPLIRVPLEEAIRKEGVVYDGKVQECLNGVCGV